ncbi:MAG: flagellar motor protein MotB [Bacteroidetes bacterium]|nr:MAG: flagellar motor protein MotB [Bacteroidota bacterium]
MLRFIYIFLFLSSYSYAQEMRHNVYFETDRYTIVSSEESRLNSFVSSLDSLTIKTITVYGYCDDRGTKTYNLKLSELRAESIKEYLVDSELPEKQIKVIDGKGELALNETDNISEIRQINRRVEIVVTASSSVTAIEKPTTQSILKGDIKVGDKIRLKNIYFKSSYSTIVPGSIPTLKEIATILVERKNIYFTIQGHVCCTHDNYDAIDRKTNQRNLSHSRAKFIYTYLLQQGVAKHRMKYVGLKRKFPLGGDPKFDRRVEVLITHIGKDN